MRTYKLTVAYDGTRYQGWQRQENTDNTIQGILEKAVSEETGFDVEVNGSGRTDAGVHARGQTASIVLPGRITEAEIHRTAERQAAGGYPRPSNGACEERLPCEKERVRQKYTNTMWIRENGRMCLRGGTVIISLILWIWMQ